MATATTTKHTLAGSLGEILVDLRTGDRRNPRPAVIILHGFKGFKDWGMFPLAAERLARAGMTALSLNVSGSGVDDQGQFTHEDRFGRNTYSAELEDLHRTALALRLGDPFGIPAPTSLGILGHSRGGGIAILETAQNQDVRCLVTWAAIGKADRWSADARDAWRRRGYLSIQNARTGQTMPLSTDVLDDIDQNARSTLDIAAAGGRIERPWLIIHGAGDETVAPEDAQALHLGSGSRARLLMIPDTGHTFGATHPLQTLPPALDLALGETVNWFSRFLA